MVLEIQSKEVIDKISEELKVQPSLQVPRKLAEQIQLSFNVNPDRIMKASRGYVSDATPNTVAIFTTSSEKDTFLTGCLLTTAKDANSTSVESRISCTPFGSGEQRILVIRYEPLTAGQFSETITFPIPIKLERNTAVNVTNGTGVASIDTDGLAYYYETDPQ